MGELMKTLTWEIVARPPIEGMRVETVMVYYHNDREYGFGVGLDWRTPDLEQRLRWAFEAYKLVWDTGNDEQRKELLDSYYAQVEYAARNRERVLETYPVMILIMDVIWLAYYTDMVIDEYNGPQFVWGTGAELPVKQKEAK